MSTDTLIESNVDQKTDTITQEKGDGQGPPPILEERVFDPGDYGTNGETGTSTGNAFLGMMLFIGADVMLFAGLIGAFIIFRFGTENWPPPGQPRLPIGVTGVNTVILLYSGYIMMRTWRILKDGNRQKIIQGLALSALLGATFLIVQGREWIRLLQFGLTLSSSVYGATFYVLIGCHALHVFGAVVWLLGVLLKLVFSPGSYGPLRHLGIKLIGMYWFLVVALWPLLYGLVYLT